MRPIASVCDILPSTALTYMEKLRELGASYGGIMEMDDNSHPDLLYSRGEQTAYYLMDK